MTDVHSAEPVTALTWHSKVSGRWFAECQGISYYVQRRPNGKWSADLMIPGDTREWPVNLNVLGYGTEDHAKAECEAAYARKIAYELGGSR